MGVAQIDRNQLEAEFAIVKDARELHLEHGGWLTDNTEDFSDELVNLHEGDHRFEIMGSEPNPGIDVNFECSFRDSMIERDIQKQQKELTEELAQTFSAALSNEELVPEKSSTAKIPAKEYDWEQVVKDELERLIDGSEFEGTGELLGALLDEAERDGDADPFAIPQSEVETGSEVIAKLFEAYLQPLGETVADLQVNLQKLKHPDNVGTIDRLKRLKGIAEGPGAVAGGVEVPRPDPGITDKDEMTGRDIAGLGNQYDTELESSTSGDEGANPYRKQRNVSPEDLAEDAEHVGDTDVWENNKDKILDDFAVAVGNLDDERVPLNEPEPTSHGEEVSRFYEGMCFHAVYLSPEFDHDAGVGGARFEEVFEALPLNNKSQSRDLYSAETYDSGHPHEFTMVLFIGGNILDNLAPVTKMDGYKDTFDTRYNEQEVPGAFQTIGLGAQWDKWDALGQWAATEATDQEIEDAYGAYVYRDEIRPMDEDFVSEIMQSDANEDATTADVLLDMYDIDLYESTVGSR
ncbi:hypothetical protein SAMN05216226_1211 [Halovenus aranensis]|uniref:Uncharacterized protein n=1 Tax=Halovenus aranensis TaxID=890420 RepID=A0A1G8ZF88_9EURY|nr:hypothetical protein [Halovenus aranensis]SDK12830.1 hypothetical protein SAMN05216226_1211 [Halovenus aranensis]